MSEINLDNLAVVCMDVGGKARYVKSCLKCEHYGGMKQISDDPNRSPEENYHIICNRPRTRRMERIEE